ncbi:MAG: hypothetical protein ACTHZ5_01045 [Micrococcaceae bacterium]
MTLRPHRNRLAPRRGSRATLSGLGIVALILAGCGTGSETDPDPTSDETLADLTAQQARDASIGLVEQIQELVPEEAIDDDGEPLPSPGANLRSLITCQELLGDDSNTSDSGSAHDTAVTYPGRASLRLTDSADGETLAEDLLERLAEDEGWEPSERVVSVDGEEQINRSLTTDDGYLVNVSSRISSDGDQLLTVSAWSPCFTLSEDESIHDKY